MRRIRSLIFIASQKLIMGSSKRVHYCLWWLELCLTLTLQHLYEDTSYATSSDIEWLIFSKCGLYSCWSRLRLLATPTRNIRLKMTLLVFEDAKYGLKWFQIFFIIDLYCICLGYFNWWDKMYLIFMYDENKNEKI